MPSQCKHSTQPHSILLCRDCAVALVNDDWSHLDNQPTPDYSPQATAESVPASAFVTGPDQSVTGVNDCFCCDGATYGAMYVAEWSA